MPRPEHERPEGCRSCPLDSLSPAGFVPDEGSLENAEIAFLGEAPGKMEITQGRPFYGQAGILLRGDIPVGVIRHIPELAALLQQGKVYLSNTLRCLPPANRTGKNYPTEPERSAAERCCRQYDPDWAQLRAKVVVCLGAEASRVFTGLEEGILKRQGGWIEREEKVWVRAVHPAYVLRQPQTLDLLLANVRLALAVRQGFRRASFRYRRGEIAQASPGPTGIDLEWNKERRITVYGWTSSETEACAVYAGSPGLEQAVAQVLRGARPLVGHNLLAADLPALASASFGRPESGDCFDTLLAFHLTHAHLAGESKYTQGDRESQAFGLLDLRTASTLLDPEADPDWKQYDLDILGTCAGDALRALRLHSRLAPLLNRYNLRPNLAVAQRAAQVCLKMSERGLRLDPAVVDELRASRIGKQAAALDNLPPALNPRSVPQIKAYFRERYGLELPDTRKDTLRRYAKKYPEAAALTEYKGAGKKEETWFGEEDLARGFLHPRFNIHGTEVGRLSSASPNVQNIPPSHRRAVIASDLSLELLALDMEQAENRAVAWLAGDQEMLQAFASGRDFHTENAQRIRAQLGAAFEETVARTGRDARALGKSVSHATNYGEGPHNLARRIFNAEYPTKAQKVTAIRLQQAYFHAYPKIREWQKRVEREVELNGVLTNPFGRRLKIVARDLRDATKIGLAFLGASTIADWGLRHLLALDAEGCRLVNFVHDEFLLEWLRGESAQRLVEICETPLEQVPGLKIPVKVGRGANWGAAKA